MDKVDSEVLPVEHTAAVAWRTYDELSLPPILGAALIDFQEHGYHGTTVRKIASNVGLTMPSLYYHYGNKEGILFALLDIAMDDLLARIQGGLNEAGSDTQTKFTNYAIAVALHNTYRRNLSKLHDEFRVLGPEFRAKYVAKRTAAEESLIELLDKGAAEGIFEPDDSHFMSRVILGMLSGIVDWYSDGGSLSADEIAVRYARCAERLVAVRRG